MTHRNEPTVDDVKAFWESHVNNEYYTGARRGSAAYFDEITERRYRWHYHLADYFRSLEGSSGKLLEIGCGIGVDSLQLAKCGFEVTGIDLTDAAIEIARQHAAHRGARNVTFQVANAEALPFEDESFDAVYSFGVLHHTPDIEKAVSEVRRVLRPGGVAHVMLYHSRSLVDLVHQVFRLPYESPRDLADHCPVVYRFHRDSVRRLFREFGGVDVWTDYPFTYGFRRLTGWIPVSVQRRLGRRIGWHLMIRATK